MKLLKKLSLVYTLQVLAVILLFSYAGSSSVKEIKGSVTDMVLPLPIYKDSLITGANNAMWKISTGKNK